MTCSDISIQGRVTSGVKLMNLDEKETVASIARVRESHPEEKGEVSEAVEEEADLEDEENLKDQENDSTEEEPVNS